MIRTSRIHNLIFFLNTKLKSKTATEKRTEGICIFKTTNFPLISNHTTFKSKNQHNSWYFGLNEIQDVFKILFYKNLWIKRLYLASKITIKDRFLFWFLKIKNNERISQLIEKHMYILIESFYNSFMKIDELRLPLCFPSQQYTFRRNSCDIEETIFKD